MKTEESSRPSITNSNYVYLYLGNRNQLTETIFQRQKFKISELLARKQSLNSLEKPFIQDTRFI